MSSRGGGPQSRLGTVILVDGEWVINVYTAAWLGSTIICLLDLMWPDKENSLQSSTVIGVVLIIIIIIIIKTL